jgi:hypothetical protein
MFDADYFHTSLKRDADAMGSEPVIEVQLLNGHTHRVRSVVEVGTGCVTLETFQMKGDFAHQRPHFGAPSSDPSSSDTYRTVIAYESIAAVVFDPSPTHVKASPGFTRN